MLMKFQRNLKSSLGLALATFFLMGCSDFLNSGKSNPEVQGSIDVSKGPKRPDVNPFPPGFENPNLAPFTEEKMLVNIGVNVIAPAAKDLALEAAVLAKRIAQTCQTITVNDTSMTDWKEAQSQWKRTMLAYHRVDSFPVGPLWSEDKKLSARLYAWPLFNSCGIDAETVRVKERVATAVEDLPNPVRGLAAIEYLLFEKSMTTKCNARAYPQVTKWAALSTAEKRRDRCALALRLVADISGQAEFLADEWNPAGKNYSRRFIDKSDAAYPNALAAANAVTDSLFQIEALKDLRLARPLGLLKDCVSADGKCPHDSEHIYSDLALEAIGARLSAFGDAFRGQFTGLKTDRTDGTSRTNGVNDGFGFDDFLSSRGHAAIALRFGGLIDKVKVGFQKYSGSVGGGAGESGKSFVSVIDEMSKENCLASTPEQRQVEICALFQEIRTVTVSLKTEFLAVLALRSPPTYQGDND